MKGFVCTESAGGQYVNMNGEVKYARSGQPFYDADPKQMLRKSKDEKGNEVIMPRYGFTRFDGSPIGTSAAATAREMKKLAAINEGYKAENDELRARLDELEANAEIPVAPEDKKPAKADTPKADPPKADE